MPRPGSHVIVVGNEKGGSGKSTACMHLIVALLHQGRRVAAVDLDLRQGTLARFLANRAATARAAGIALAMPDRGFFSPADAATPESALESLLSRLAAAGAVVVIDTPGNDTPLTRLAHARADTIVTPVNDSFVDLDAIARVDSGTLRVLHPGHYAELVWQARKARATRDGASIDWIVMRNRLSSLDARNKRDVERVLDQLGHRFGIRLVAGFGERVIFRELFGRGLTLMDLGTDGDGTPLTLSHVAARQEVRGLVSALRLP